MMHDEPGRMHGIENRIQNHRSTGNIYEYRDTAPLGLIKPRHLQTDPRRTASTPTLRTGSSSSLKDAGIVVSSVPSGDSRKQRTPIVAKRTITKTDKGIPQTDV